MSYITQVREIIGYPVTAVVLNPTVEYDYGDRFGITLDGLYASADCVDSAQGIELGVGMLCTTIAPFYRYTINKFKFDGCLGMLRIDAAGLASVSLPMISYSGLIDTTQAGFYAALRGTYTPRDMLGIKLLLSTATLKAGSFMGNRRHINI